MLLLDCRVRRSLIVWRSSATRASPRFRPRIGVRGMLSIARMTNAVR